MDILERVNQLKEQIRLSDSPPGWEEGRIVGEGKTPWWKIENPKERSRGRVFQWKRMHPEASAKGMRKWNDRNPGMQKERMIEFYDRHPGYGSKKAKESREKHPGVANERLKEFYKTPKGRIARAKMNASRREHSTDPALYAARVVILHTQKESCAKCHTEYDITNQVDHIVALCLGGTDDWDNLQPLCILCHRKKTEEDMRKLIKERS